LIRSITVDLGALDPKLSPNARVHWKAKMGLVETAVDVAIAAARDAWNRAEYDKPFELARIDITDYWCGIEPDHDNFVAQCKSYIDGIRRAGVFVDDDPKHLIRSWPLFTRVKTKAERRVVVEITEVVK
jgi:hypothetical protein